LYLEKEKVRELMKNKADGNYNEFSRQLGVDVAHLHRVLNTESKAGPKLLGRLMVFCKENDLDFNNYIFFR
jgi:hypothetical protein